MDHCAIERRTRRQSPRGEDECLANFASPGGACAYPGFVFHLYRWLRLLVLGADDAAAFHRLECAESGLVWSCRLRSGTYRYAAHGLELRSPGRTPLAFCYSAISCGGSSGSLVLAPSFELSAGCNLCRAWLRHHRLPAFVLGSAISLSYQFSSRSRSRLHQLYREHWRLRRT